MEGPMANAGKKGSWENSSIFDKYVQAGKIRSFFFRKVNDSLPIFIFACSYADHARHSESVKKMNKRPLSLFILAALLAIQSLGGLFGGFSLVLSPSGEIMKMPLGMLEGSPFTTFLLPGLILLVFLGFFPGILAYALILRPGWKWFGCLNIYQGIHWAWTYTLYLGIMLAIWIFIEIIWINYDILQTIFGMVGVIIIILVMMPANMRFFGWKSSPE